MDTVYDSRIALTPGTKIGSHQVSALIGVGGMGEVYRARDTRLNRDVALKVLPDSFAQDPERLARFKREAQTLASLNHPNIAQIYGIEESGGVLALVMELVEGEDLSQRIARGAIPLDEALPIAKQIAEALEAAHAAAIIHRDLKPANIKIRPDGTVKVLDFGLAKAFADEEADLNLSNSPTLSMAATRQGVILGTAAYMSPEQARGKAVDKRADIWAFGVVLYEMLTGARPFPGDDLSQTLARVIEREPDWDALPRHIPPVLAPVLRRCLEKNAKQRIADIHDVRLALEGAFDPDIVAGAAVPAAQGRPRLWIAAGIVAALATGVFVLGGWWAGASRSVAPQPVRRFPLTLPAAAELPTGAGTLVAISPDGQTLVFRAREGGVYRLYQRNLDQLDTMPIPGTENVAELMFFSPDGRWLGFPVGTTLMKVALAGGRPVRIGELPMAPRGASWGADDTIIVGRRDGGGSPLRLPAGGGEPTAIAKPDDGRLFWYPQILPGGRTVLFTASLNLPDTGDVMALDLQTGKVQTLVSGGVAGHYVPTGHLVFVRGGDIWAVRFDPARAEAAGDAVVVEQGVRVEGGGAVQMAVAGDGSLAYIPGGTGTRRTLVWVDREGREEATDMPPRDYRSVRLSPDGLRVAVEVRAEERDIWVWDLARKALQPLTLNSSGGGPVWTHDASRIAFFHLAEQKVYWQPADGSGVPEPLTEKSTRAIWPRAFSPDGKRLLMSDSAPPRDIHVLELEAGQAGQAPKPLLGTAFEEHNPEVSPNGRWLAYESNESGRPEVYVRPFPDVSSGKRQISTAGGTRPIWSRDERELFYAGTGTVMAVPILNMATTFTAGQPKVVVEGDYWAIATIDTNTGRTWDVSLDGKRFLMVKDVDTGGDAPPAQIVLVQHWFEELKRLLPAP